MPKCMLTKKKGSRWCSFHQCHQDNRRHFKEFGPGGSSAKRDAWMKQMAADINFAIEELTLQETICAGIKKWGKSTTKQHESLQLQEKSGSTLNDKSGVIVVPYEKEEWILRQINKKGRTREWASNRWNEHLAGKWTQDYKGEDGQIRLWLPKYEFTEQSRSKFLENSSFSNSDVIKNPSQDDVYALSMFIHARHNALTFNHSFFTGGCGIPYISEKGGSGSDEQEDGGAADPSTPKKGGEEGAQPAIEIKPLKGPIVSLRVRVSANMDKSVNQVFLFVSF